MAVWQPIASIVMIAPSSSSKSSRVGIAVICVAQPLGLLMTKSVLKKLVACFISINVFYWWFSLNDEFICVCLHEYFPLFCEYTNLSLAYYSILDTSKSCQGYLEDCRDTSEGFLDTSKSCRGYSEDCQDTSEGFLDTSESCRDTSKWPLLKKVDTFRG